MRGVGGQPRPESEALLKRSQLDGCIVCKSIYVLLDTLLV
jgi:hypothetical protein